MPLLRLPWPLSALIVWACAWLVFVLLQGAGWPVVALLGGCVLGTAGSLLGNGWWRRGLIALGFPLSLALLGAARLPISAWLGALVLLLWVYPLNAWRDARYGCTPTQALLRLATHAPLPLGARVLDAGCGLGAGLKALHHSYPAAHIDGLEWRWPLFLLCALRCPWAHVIYGDLWLADWRGYQMVYLFHGAKGMARAAAKAQAELAPGAWLVSLESAVPGVLPSVQLRAPAGGVVWLYRMPLHRVEHGRLPSEKTIGGV